MVLRVALRMCLLLVFLVTSTVLFAQIPRVISYQGVIKNTDGSMISDGSHSLAISLYDAPIGGNVLHTEMFFTQIKNGLFTLLIGSSTPFPSSLTFDKQYYLGIQVDGGEEMTPRTAFTSSPYALRSLVAEYANNVSPSAKGVVTSLNELSGNIRIIGDSTIELTRSGQTLLLHGLQYKGIDTLASPGGTLAVTNAGGPIVSADVADNSISTQKLKNGAVTSAKLNQMGATNGQVLMWNGTLWAPGSAGIANVTVNAPLTGNGSVSSPITLAAANGSTSGYLTSSDWTIFNNKLSSVAVTPRLTGNGTNANPLEIAQQGASNGQVLTWNGTSWAPANPGALSVFANTPITGNGTSANPLAIAQANGSTNGYLSSGDWTTFNNKLSSVIADLPLTGSGMSANHLRLTNGTATGDVLTWNGSSWVSATPTAGLTSVSANAPITGNGTSASPLTILSANSTRNGYLTSTDWTTFNNKLSSVAVTARLTGNGTPASPLDIAQQGATTGQVLTWNGSSWAPANSGVTSVFANSPITGNGTSGNPLSIVAANGSTNGYLTSSDWTTFNNKLSTVTADMPLTGTGTSANHLRLTNGTTSGDVLTWNGTSWVSSAPTTGLTSVTADAPLTGNGTSANHLRLTSGTTSGDVLTWNGTSWASAAFAGWKLSGNSLTGSSSSSPSEFFGSNNNYDLVFKSNTSERMRILTGGNVGIGTPTPSDARLVVSSTFPGGSTQRHGEAVYTFYPSSMSDGSVPYNSLEAQLISSNTSNINLVDGAIVAITSMQGTAGATTARGLISVAAFTSGASGITYGHGEGVVGRIWTPPSGATGSATITNARSLRADIWLQNSTTNITNGYGLFVDNPNVSAGSITNFNAVYVQNLSVSATTKNAFFYDGSSGNVPVVVASTGRVGIGTSSPSQLVEVLGGNLLLSNNGGTSSKILFQEPSGSGTNVSSFTAGAQSADINYTLPTSIPAAASATAAEMGSGMMLTSSSGTLSWKQAVTASASLTFNNTVSGATNDQTITVNGARSGDIVSIGIPNGAMTLGNVHYIGWVSADNTVSIRFYNNSGGALAPTGTFSVMVVKP